MSRLREGDAIAADKNLIGTGINVLGETPKLKMRMWSAGNINVSSKRGRRQNKNVSPWKEGHQSGL